MINKHLFTSNKDDWETPQHFFDYINKIYHFKWDLAASDSNAKCDNFITKQQDSLNKNWGG